MKSRIWLVLILAILLALGYGAWQARLGGDADVVLQSQPCMDGECQIIVDGRSYRLSLGQIHALKLFMLSFSSNVTSLEQVTLQLEMSGMDMQQPRLSLPKVGQGVWQREVMLPVCSTGRSDWLAIIRFQHHGLHYRLEFPFQAY